MLPTDLLSATHLCWTAHVYLPKDGTPQGCHCPQRLVLSATVSNEGNALTDVASQPALGNSSAEFLSAWVHHVTTDLASGVVLL